MVGPDHCRPAWADPLIVLKLGQINVGFDPGGNAHIITATSANKLSQKKIHVLWMEEKAFLVISS